MAIFTGKNKKSVEDQIKAEGKKPDGKPILPDGAEMYYEDHFALKQWERELQPATETANILKSIYERITGFKISNIGELYSLATNAPEFFRQQHTAANAEEIQRFTKLKIAFTIELPDRWDDVLHAVRRFSKHAGFITQQFLTIQNDEVVTTEKYYLRRNSRCYLYAVTPEEKERLSYCLEVISAIEKLEPILLKDPKHGKAVREKTYALPLPYFLKIVDTSKGPRLIPNHNFITDEFGGTGHTGRYILNKAERKAARMDAMPKLGEKWVMFKRLTRGASEAKLFTCLESEYPKLKDPNDILLPGSYNEFGESWGTPIDRTKSRPAPVTQWNPFIGKEK